MMIEIRTELSELFEGEVAGGRNFWWVKGTDTVLSQEWNHQASGRVYEAVEAYTTTYEDMAAYIVDVWNEYKVVDITEVKGL